MMRLRTTLLPVLFLLGSLAGTPGDGSSGCASSLHVNDAPDGSYTFRIIGTGAVSGATHSGTVSLTVTQ